MAKCNPGGGAFFSYIQCLTTYKSCELPHSTCGILWSTCCEVMAKHSCATSLVALALLGCLLATLVEAQDKWWQKQQVPPKTGQSTYKPKPKPQAPPVLPVAPVAPQKPQSPPVTSQKPQTPPGTNVQTCDVEPAQRVSCGYVGMTAYDCDAIGCCFDGQNCFYGKAGECLAIFWDFIFKYLIPETKVGLCV